MGEQADLFSDGSHPHGDLMLMTVMQRFSTEDTARAYFEALRWPCGPVCPHCGNALADRIYKVTPNPEKKIRAGLYKCAECEQGFTVTVGTVMEDTHLPLNKWLIAFYMMCASKTQISALQLQRQLEIGSYRSALFLTHRIRYALKDADPRNLLVGTIEADETYVGGRARGKGRGYLKNKTPVVALVERGGSARSHAVERITGEGIATLLSANIDVTVVLNTDQSPVYAAVGKDFAAHNAVNHFIEEYSRNDEHTGRQATVNAGSFFGNSKLLIDGTHHLSGIKRMEGKHLMLRRLIGKA